MVTFDESGESGDGVFARRREKGGRERKFPVIKVNKSRLGKSKGC